MERCTGHPPLFPISPCSDTPFPPLPRSLAHQGHPTHLGDACTGQLRCNRRAHNSLKPAPVPIFGFPRFPPYQGHPIHLWDACSGQLRCSYRAHNDMDEPTAAYSIAFSPDGGKLLGGYAKSFRIFDLSRPGRDCRTVQTQRRGREGSMAGAGSGACMHVLMCVCVHVCVGI